MFKKKDLDLIDHQLEKFYQKNLSETTESLRQRVSDDPTQWSNILRTFDLTKLQFKFRKEREKITLAIMSWYFPDEIRALTQVGLQETWQSEIPGLKEVLLNSKDYALTWLIAFSKWNESDFFGNVLDKRFVRLFRLTDFKRVSKRKVQRYTGYCRGHRDNHRGAPSSLSLDLLARMTTEDELQEELLLDQKRTFLMNEVESYLNSYILDKMIEELEFVDFE